MTDHTGLGRSLRPPRPDRPAGAPGGRGARRARHGHARRRHDRRGEPGRGGRHVHQTLIVLIAGVVLLGRRGRAGRDAWRATGLLRDVRADRPDTTGAGNLPPAPVRVGLRAIGLVGWLRMVGGHMLGARGGHVVAGLEAPRHLSAGQMRTRQVPLAVVMVALTTLTLWSLGQALVVTPEDDASGRRSIRTSRGSIGKVPYGHSARNRSRLTTIEVGHRRTD